MQTSIHCSLALRPAYQTSGIAVQSLFGSSARSPWTGALLMTVPPYLLKRCESLVWGRLLYDHEQCRGPWLEPPADLVNELFIDTRLLDLGEESSEACADCYTKDRDEEQTAEEQPQNIPHAAPCPTEWWLVVVLYFPSLSHIITATSWAWITRSDSSL